MSQKMEKIKNIFGIVYERSDNNQRKIYRKKLQAFEKYLYKNFVSRLYRVPIEKMNLQIVVNLTTAFCDGITDKDRQNNPIVYAIAKALKENKLQEFKKTTSKFKTADEATTI